MKLNEAVSKRLLELLDERKMTQYQLYMKSGVPQVYDWKCHQLLV